MNIFVRLCSRLLGLAVLTALNPNVFAQVASPLPPAAAIGHEDAASNLSLKGVAFLVGKWFASITNEGDGGAQWVCAGDFVTPGILVKEITSQYAVVAELKSGKEHKLFVPGSARRVDSKGKPMPERYSKAWINSKENPMIRYVQDLPYDLYRNWPKLSEAEKAEVIDFYKKHGWQITVAVTRGEVTDFAFKEIYQEERQAAMLANRDAFERKLRPEQVALWNQMRRHRKIYAANGVYSEAQRKEIAERAPVIEQFKNTLTAEQKAEWESISDFTKADWSK